jgi:hypothetical protein
MLVLILRSASGNACGELEPLPVALVRRRGRRFSQLGPAWPYLAAVQVSMEQVE